MVETKHTGVRPDEIRTISRILCDPNSLIDPDSGCPVKLDGSGLDLMILTRANDWAGRPLDPSTLEVLAALRLPSSDPEKS